jgi:ribosomal protein L11 methyltransferase
MACGTGLHPATQLCLIALERWIATGTSVLDVGTGTGILAEAARLLGAGTVIACDISPEAAGIARVNLPRSIGVYAGSLRSIRPASIDVAVANLNAETLAANCRGIRACIRPQGRIILSGFRVSESAGVVAAIGRPALRLEQSEDWACLVF